MSARPALTEEPLQTVTVEASPLDVYVPARTEISRQDIVDSHKSELTDVLEITPGMNVRQGGLGEQRADMRGFDQRATLFTLNGVPVYEPYNGIVNLDVLPLEMLDSIETARGPSSSLFGPNGMAGTVKMSTLTPRVPVAAAVSTLWRNPGFWDVRGSASLERNGVSGVVGGRFLTSSGFPLSGEFEDRPPGRNRFSEDDGTRLNSDREEWSAFADLGYAFSHSGSVHATFLSSVAEFGIPPNTAQFKPLFQRNDREEFDHFQAGAEQQLAPKVAVSAAVFYSSYETRTSQFTGPDFTTKILTTTVDSDEIGGIGHVTLELGEHDSLVIGGQIRQAGADISDSVNGPLGQPDFTTASTAFENAYFLTDQVRLLTGLSYDLQTGGGRGTAWELEPEGGLSVDFGRFGVSRAGVSRKIRFPTLRELFDPQQGNSHLQPEKALSYEVGHRLEVDRSYLDASLFRSDVTDLIDNGTIGTQQRAMNLDEAVLQGFEAAAGSMLMQLVRLDLNYTYLDAQARNTSAGGSGAFMDIQHKPAHRLNGILRLFLPEKFVLRLEGLYTSEQVDTFGSNVKAGAFGLFNVQLSKSFGKHLDVFAGVDNALDTDYEQKYGSPEPGRWEYVGLRASL
ncbi:MAG: TonB-dependent receptor plug domain-containing protein [Candidatus Binatia bacterium]